MNKSKKPNTMKVLAILKNAKSVSADALSNRTKMPYASVRKRIFDLREEGYDIETVTRRGNDGASKTVYRLS